jgi:GTPase
MVDGASEHPAEDFQQINSELVLFDERLGERPQLVVINKLDIPEAQERFAELEKKFSDLGYPVLGISAVTQRNTRDLINRLFQMVDELPEAPEVLREEEVPLYEMKADPNTFTVEKMDDRIYKVTGQSIERAVAKTIWYSDEAVRRFQKILEVIGITEALEKEGVQTGDTVIIGEMELEWGE